MTRYEQGFMNKCAEYGVPTVAASRMLKQAGIWSRLKLGRIGKLKDALKTYWRDLSGKNLAEARKALNDNDAERDRIRRALNSVYNELAKSKETFLDRHGWSKKVRNLKSDLEYLQTRGEELYRDSDLLGERLVDAARRHKGTLKKTVLGGLGAAGVGGTAYAIDRNT